MKWCGRSYGARQCSPLPRRLGRSAGDRSRHFNFEYFNFHVNKKVFCVLWNDEVNILVGYVEYLKI